MLLKWQRKLFNIPHLREVAIILGLDSRHEQPERVNQQLSCDPASVWDGRWSTICSLKIIQQRGTSSLLGEEIKDWCRIQKNEDFETLGVLM